MIECNRNCLECPYPDVPDECLEAALTWDEWQELDVIDKDIINPKTAKQKAVAARRKAYREANKDKVAAWQKAWYEANKDKVAARQKAYYAANKDKIAAWQKAWYEANKDKVAARQKAWYEANKDKVAARQKAYRAANKDKVAARQKSIALARKARGMTQIELAAIVGVTQATVSLWETGAVKASWDKLCAVLPDLEAHRP